MNVSEYVMNFLYENNIRQAFMLPGGGNNQIIKSLFTSKLQTVCCHHEAANGMAAEAYSKYTGTPCAVFGTTGPGSTNMITALTEAFGANVPVMFFSGQSKSNQTIRSKGLNLRQVGVQEVDIIPAVSHFTKYAESVYEPKKIKFYLEKALHMAVSGRPGPVWLEIPVDIQGALIEESELIGYDKDSDDNNVAAKISNSDIDKVVALMKSAKKPVIVSGRGVRISGAVNELNSLAKRLSIPIVTTYLGKDTVPWDSDSNMGVIGVKGTRHANITVSKSDLVISIGSRLCIASTGYAYSLFARNATTVVVDIDETEHKKNTVRIDHFIKGDAKDFISRFTKRADEITSYDGWLAKCVSIKKRLPVCPEEFKKDYDNGINPYYFIERITSEVGSETPIVADAGTSFFIGAQGSMIKANQRHITSYNGTMGYGLPASIGTSIAINKGKVIVFIGDGSIQQCLQELQTIVHHRLPIKIFILNNKGYFSMKTPESRKNSEDPFCEKLSALLSFPDFKKLADAYGITHYKIEKMRDFDTAEHSKLLSSFEPVIFEVAITTDMAVYTVATFQNKDGSISTRPTEDMFPFLEEAELKEIMEEDYYPRGK